MEKGVWRRKEKQDMDENRGRETACVCVSGSNLCFFLCVALKEWAVELMQPNQVHVCAGAWCSGKCERRQTGPSVLQYKQISPAHLFFSHSHTLGVLRTLLRPACKGSFAISVLSYIPHGGRIAARQ